MTDVKIILNSLVNVVYPLKKQAPQCFTDFKACFSTQLTDGLR